MSWAVQASLPFNIQPKGVKLPFVRHFEADRQEASARCDLKRTAWQMTCCDWCSKQLSRNRRWPAQRSQAKNNEGGEKNKKKEKPCRAGLRVTCVSSGLTTTLSSSTQSSNNPLRPPPKEKLKAFFWKKSSLLRLLLFTFGRTAIAGRVQTQEKASGDRKSCRQAGRLAEMLRAVVPFPAGEQPWVWH